ncbi:MAG: DUF2975 domain-containing protein [Oscillospiraceae bacterium]|nr:DUF2975 domain-containing protein [Oscillospiraceae bacterium]
MKKIEKISNVIFVILRALQVVSVVIAVLCAAVFVAELFTHSLSTSISVDLGYVTLDVADEIIPTILNSQAFLIIVLIMSIAVLSIIFMILQLLCKIFDPMRKGRPFEKSVSSSIKRIALLVLCGGTVCEILKNMLIAYLTSALNIAEILLNEYIVNVNVDMNFNGVYIVFAVLLWLIALVFEYGAMLQQESDETL